MNPRRLILSFFLLEFALPLSMVIALPACPGQSFYLKSGEALEIEFNRRPGCDVRFIIVERGLVHRKLFYSSGKTDDRRLTARAQDIPEAWSELPRKAYLKASAETVVKFLAEPPRQKAPEPTPVEACPDNLFKLTPGEEIVVLWGNRPGCMVRWIDYSGTVVEFITYPSGRKQRRIIRPDSGAFIYPETPLSLRIKAITPATVKFLAQKPVPAQSRPPTRLPTPQIQAQQQPRPQPIPSFPGIPMPTPPTSGFSTEGYLMLALSVLIGCGLLYGLIRAAKTSSIFVISNWSKLIENLEASPKDFYTAVEQAIAKRQVPAIDKSRVDWKEGGLFTSFREYLRISREKNVFDICGAPYGTSFFVSWWHSELRPSALGPTLIMIAIVFFSYDAVAGYFGFLGGFFITLIGFILIFLFVGILVNHSAGENWVRYVLVIPVVGWMIERFFLPPTYYRMDSAAMFEASIHQSVQEVIDQMTQAKGLRALTELERKPTLREFFRR